MSQRSYTQHKVIVHPRDASTDSRTSSSSRSSAEEYSSSTSSRTSTTNGFDPVDGIQYRRVPDNEDGYMTTRTISTPRRIIEVHDHQKARHTEDEPPSSGATYEEYRKTQQRKPRK
ncbi:hypothetical protein NA56DRAFT_487012 [Hyaloscypha hepaticicola]|uniref:Uncharacterized protein n=1 Tax=Hyaloscypha hepaticicola TaxID=2082293 RepID=A0A2J6QDU0_9HELO|nr:hypothetical protein NA56DRAFT_487012 [Hyaloscypha hepaticicola]